MATTSRTELLAALDDELELELEEESLRRALRHEGAVGGPGGAAAQGRGVERAVRAWSCRVGGGPELYRARRSLHSLTIYLPEGTADPAAKVAARWRAAETLIEAARERRRDAIEG
ncbi:unnamed protein product [Prorocentrum cordatum]|uniref:Uncharacterized protein n=1 Tax=Prorocentrum cordatum TaxID=2364126 RepID=A0ABN9UB67_9DINO|nr:unnamed protein product [Polarella glacialis]